MSRTKLVDLSGVSKQQLSRLENGQIRLRLDHLKPFAAHLGYTPEQILLWGRFPGTGASQIGSSEAGRAQASQEEMGTALPGQVPELDLRGDHDGGVKTRKSRKDGRHTDPVKSEGWVFPPSFVRDQLHTSAERLLVLGTSGDSMAPTLTTGDRVIIDTGHKKSYSRRALCHSRRVRRHCRQAPAIAALRPASAGKDHFRQYQSRDRGSAAQRAGDRRQSALLPQASLSADTSIQSPCSQISRRN